MIRHHYRAAAVLFATFACFSETVVLKNGTTIRGALVSMDAHEIVLERCGRLEHVAKQDVNAVQMDTVAGVGPCPAIPSKLEIPSGFPIKARMADYVDSLREPSGQVFLATLDAPIAIDGRTIVQQGARLLLKMIEIDGGAGGPIQTLDLIGIEQRKSSWINIQPAGEPLAVAEIDSDPALTLTPVQPKAVVRGDRLVVPSNTRLVLTLKRPVRL
jgi:hypothetical protein